MKIGKVENCLVIGLGQIGLKYDIGLSEEYVLTHSRSVDSHPEFELVGGVDKNKINRDTFVKNYGKPVYSDIKKGILETKPSIIIISSPTSTHLSILDNIIEASSPKAILCEKPLDSDPNNASEMIKKCSDNDIQLFVNYIRRCDPGSLQIKKMIDMGKINKPIKGIVWYSKGLKNNGSHFINLLESWFGECTNVKNISKGKSYIDLEDNDYDFTLSFQNVEIIFYSSLENSNSYNSIELMSSSGRLLYENGGDKIFWQAVNESNLLDSDKKLIQENMNKYQYNVLNSISNVLKNKNTSISRGEDAYKTQKTIMRIINGEKNGN
jgi:predicted dehydrogenase